MSVVEVDQSGKVESTQKPTALAFANGKTYSIRISAQAKRTVLQELERRKPTRSRTMHRLLVFATLLFLLLKDHIDELNHIVVDVEYQGHMPMIKEHVLNLFRRQGVAVDPGKIVVRRIGKKSAAHGLAIKVFRGRTNPDKEIKAEEVLAEF